MALLTVENLTKKYDNNLAVNDLHFNCQQGKCIALIGPNGAGKTTTLRMLAGLIKPTTGKIRFSGVNETVDRRALIGYLPQYPVFHDWMTGLEFLIYSGELAFLSKSLAKQRAEILLDKVGILQAKNRRISKYSGGMKQRLGIAQAIIHQPKLLMLDEPVSSLDPIGRRDILTLMEELKEDMTILFSTHILSDADEISDELLLLHEGNIVESGSMPQLREKYHTTKIELEFAENTVSYEQEIELLPSVTDTFIKRNILHVSVTNIELARQEILTVASKNNWPLTNFSVNRTSLEDLFMKVVNK